MRILVASDQWFPDFRGGAARVAADTADALSERGHAVDVVAPSAAAADGGRLRRGPFPQTLADPLVTAFVTRRLQPAHDVVVAHQATVALGVEIGAPKVPLAYVFHASAAREAAFDARNGAASHRHRALLLQSGLAQLERRALKRAARVLVLSEYSASLAAQVLPGVAPKLELVGGGVDVDRFQPGDGRKAARSRLGLTTGRPLLLTVRRLEPRMGLDLLLDVVALLDVDLVVGGVGSLEADLRIRAERLGVGDRVRFVGAVAEDHLADWYRAADAFVLPTVAYEGFGMVTAEALACGTPVVGTPVGATPELLFPLDPRFVAASTDAGDLAHAIATVLALDAGPLQRRCRDYAVTRMAWEIAAERWEQALAAASGPRPSADHRWTFFERRRGRRRLASQR
jgi:glycosyltransferase involved in cell wall biosynthesis